MNARTPLPVASPDAYHVVPLSMLIPSASKVQTLRRARMTTDSMQSITDSVRAVGILEPLLVRPRDHQFEIVAGERRYHAARAVGLNDIPVIVRDLDDTTALKLQITENLERENLAPLEEAEGFAELMSATGHTADQLAADIQRSRSHIYARLKLRNLGKDGRDALAAGTIDASKALLLARLPGNALQKRALKILTDTDYDGGPRSYRNSLRMLQNQFMKRLSMADFPLEDATLLPDAGSCTGCAHRAGNDPELLADLKGDDHCLNVPCFEAKTKALHERTLAQARASGRPVLTGDDARDACFSDRYISVDERNHDIEEPDDAPDDWEKPTWRQLVGQHIDTLPITYAEHPHRRGSLVQLVLPADLNRALEANGQPYRVDDDDTDTDLPAADPAVRAAEEAKRAKAEAAAQAKRELQLATDRAVLKQIHAKWKAPLGADQLRAILEKLLIDGEFDSVVFMLFGGDDPDWQFEPDELARSIKDTDLPRTLAALLIGQDAFRYNPDRRDLLAAAKKLRIDPEKIKKQIANERKTKTDADEPKAEKKSGKK